MAADARAKLPRSRRPRRRTRASARPDRPLGVQAALTAWRSRRPPPGDRATLACASCSSEVATRAPPSGGRERYALEGSQRLKRSHTQSLPTRRKRDKGCGRDERAANAVSQCRVSHPNRVLQVRTTEGRTANPGRPPPLGSRWTPTQGRWLAIGSKVICSRTRSRWSSRKGLGLVPTSQPRLPVAA
jgi:hypothetical protein